MHTTVNFFSPKTLRKRRNVHLHFPMPKYFGIVLNLSWGLCSQDENFDETWQPSPKDTTSCPLKLYIKVKTQPSSEFSFLSTSIVKLLASFYFFKKYSAYCLHLHHIHLGYILFNPNIVFVFYYIPNIHVLYIHIYNNVVITNSGQCSLCLPVSN